jgi:hypothetical protein
VNDPEWQQRFVVSSIDQLKKQLSSQVEFIPFHSAIMLARAAATASIATETLYLSSRRSATATMLVSLVNKGSGFEESSHASWVAPVGLHDCLPRIRALDGQARGGSLDVESCRLLFQGSGDWLGRKWIAAGDIVLSWLPEHFFEQWWYYIG